MATPVPTSPSPTATAPRTTDIRERKLQIAPTASMLQATDQGGGQAVSIPQVAPTLQPQAPGTVVGQPASTTITPENTLRDQRLGFDVNAQQVNAPTSVDPVTARDTTGSISQMFNAQLPALMQQFKDESRALVQRTAAMGRTGSGLFNRESGFVGDRALQAREGLLGKLIFQATQADAGRALQAAMGNQGAGLQSNSLAAQIAQANANRALDVDMARQNWFGNQQAREDALANSAMMNQQIQAQLLGQGFQGAPTGAIGQAANAYMQGANQYGANAGQINSQTGEAVNQAIQAWNSPQPATPPVPSNAIPSSQALPPIVMPEFQPNIPQPVPVRPDIMAPGDIRTYNMEY